MANPTQTQIDKLTTNLTRWDNIVNGGVGDTVALDSTTVKTVSGYLTELGAVNPTGVWSTTTAYALKDIVVESSIVYICVVAHTSGTFTTDLSNGYWAVYQLDVTAAITLADNLIVDTNLLYVDASSDKVGIGTSTLTRPARLHMNPDANSEGIKLGSLGSWGIWNGGYPYLASNAYTYGTSGSFKNIEAGASIGIGIISPMRGTSSLVQGGIYVKDGDASADTITSLSSYTPALTWDTDGYIGIGTETPQSILGGTIGLSIVGGASGEVRVGLKNDARLWVLENDGADSDKFKIRDDTASSDRFSIDSSGNIEIGGNVTITTGRSLTISNGNDGVYKTGDSGGWTFMIAQAQGNSSTFLGGLGAQGSGDTLTELFIGTSGSRHVRIDTSGTLLPGTDDAQDIGSGTYRYDDIYATNTTIQTSDKREKDSIRNIEYGLDFLLNLKPRSFKWKSNDDIIETRKITRQKMEIFEIEERVFENVLIEGKYVRKEVFKKIKKEKPVYEQHQVYDAKGDPISGVFHSVPVMEEVDEKFVKRKAKSHSRTHFGLIAQEVKKVLDAKGIDTNNFAPFIYVKDSDRYGLRYGEFIPILIQAVIDLNAKIAIK